MDDNSPVQNLVTTIVENIRGFGVRLMVHLGALFLAGGAGASFAKMLPPGKNWQIAIELNHAGQSINAALNQPIAPVPTATIMFCAYVGTICLIPRGMKKSSYWLFPVLTGLLQYAIWILLGTPWQLGLLWAGMQTFAQRIFLKKGRMGTEWSAAIAIFLGVILWLSNLPNPVTGIAPLWTVPVFFILGVMAHAIYSRMRLVPLRRARLEEAVRLLQLEMAAKPLPFPLQKPLQQLSEQSLHYVNANSVLDNGCERIIEDTNAIAARLNRMGVRDNSGIWDEQAEKTLLMVGKLGARLQEQIAALPEERKKAEKSAQNAMDEATEKRLAKYSDSVNELRFKKNSLPEDFQSHIEGLCSSAENIINCMRKDPEDLIPGGKFLSRYLPSTHIVVDEYIHLSQSSGKSDAVSEGLARSRELLARLEQAFAREHENLLQNDAMNFTTELNVLDTLLKMDGYGENKP